MTPRQRRWNRKHPAPPPTPEGMVYAKRYGKLQLVEAAELQRACKRSLGCLDELPENVRAEVYRTGEVPEKAEDKNKQNARTAVAGFGLAF